MNSIDCLSTFNTAKYRSDLNDLCRGSDVLWKSVATFRQACDLNVLYISGIIISSPYHCGPILTESDPISKQLAQCNRNMLFTISSEPCQKGCDIINGKEFEVLNASISFWIRDHNVNILLAGLDKERFEIRKELGSKISDMLGYNFSNHNDVASLFSVFDKKKGTNEMYQLLVKISSKFTEFPL